MVAVSRVGPVRVLARVGREVRALGRGDRRGLGDEVGVPSGAAVLVDQDAHPAEHGPEQQERQVQREHERRPRAGPPRDALCPAPHHGRDSIPAPKAASEAAERGGRRAGINAGDGHEGGLPDESVSAARAGPPKRAAGRARVRASGVDPPVLAVRRRR